MIQLLSTKNVAFKISGTDYEELQGEDYYTEKQLKNLHQEADYFKMECYEDQIHLLKAIFQRCAP